MAMASAETAVPRFEFRLLGPLEILKDGRRLKLSGDRQRALLGLLLLNANKFVSTDRIVEELLGGDPSGPGVNALQAAVSRLRRLLDGGVQNVGGVLVTERGGYVLHADADLLDVSVFERLASEGRRAIDTGDAASAAAKLREALALWRGPALADLAPFEFAQAEIRRLEEMRQSVIADRVDADLALGKGAELVSELEQLVDADPLKERFRGQLMLALYRSGRQAEALEVYRKGREFVAAELGLEPSRALQQLERSILLQDENLDPERGLREPTPIEPGRVQLCPFKGLAHFDIDDAEYFFGRERVVADLVSRVVESSLVGIVGPSGSGKSSILRAGLLAGLAGGALPGSAAWRVLVLRPGAHPAAELDRLDGKSGAQVAAAGAGGRLVLAVDQLEELFTICREPAERAAFVDSLTRAALDPERQAVVAVSLRGDFYDRFAAYPRFAELLSRNHLLVGAMERDELARAIRLPASRAGLEVERPLVDALVSDVVDEPGALPLLSATLLELWRLRQDNVLRLETYRSSGGLRGAVARFAEDAYRRLAEEDQALARRIMLRLASGEGASVVRWRRPISELDRIPGADRVLAELVRARLLTVSDGEVEVSHEALLREWPRFTTWLEESHEERRLHGHLASSAREWEARGHDPAELYRGARLANALDWSTLHAEELDALEHEFLTASRDESEREFDRQRRQNRRLRGLLVGVGLLLVLAVIAGTLALVARSNANHSATVALADSLGAQAIADPHLAQAMLLGVEAVKLDRSERTEGDLLTALLRSPTALKSYQGDGRRVNGLALSPDGRTLVLEDDNPNAIRLDSATGRRVGRAFELPTGPSASFTAAPDGELVTGDASGAQLVDPTTGAVVHQLSIDIPGLGQNARGAAHFAFADGGHRLAVAIAAASGSPAYVLQWRLPSGRAVRAPVTAPPGANLVLYSADGSRLIAIGSAQTWLLDATTGKLLRSYRVTGGGAAALSPNGHTLLIGDEAGSVQFLDLRTGALSTSISVHAGGVEQVGFTPDGETAITSGDDGEARVWDVATHQIAQTLAAHAGPIHGQAISPDGSTLYTGSFDTTALAWDLTGARGFQRSFRAATSDPKANSPNVALSPDSRALAIGATDGTVNLWDTRSLRKELTFRAGRGVVASVSFSPDGRLLLVAGDSDSRPPRGYLRIWNLRPMPRLLRSLRGLPLYTWAAFSPDGKVVAAAGQLPDQVGGANGANLGNGDGLVAEWSTATGEPLARPTRIAGGGVAIDVSFAQHGTEVALPRWDGGTAVIDPARRKVLATSTLGGGVLGGAALSPDGRRVATTDFGGYLYVWDVATGRAVLPPIHASEVNLTSVNWSQDGSHLVTAGGDGTVRLYDAKTGQQIGASLPVSHTLFPYATFSPDGRTIVATDPSGQVWLYPATASGWEASACRLANRSFTRAEWKRFVPGHGYRQVC